MSSISDQTPNSNPPISGAQLADELSKSPRWVQRTVEDFMALYETGLFSGENVALLETVLHRLAAGHRSNETCDDISTPVMTPEEQKKSLELENERIRAAFAIVGQLVAGGYLPINLNKTDWYVAFQSAIWTVVQSLDSVGM